MSKRQLIDEIRQLNPTAQPEFLGMFEETELEEYLKHLRDARDNRPQINTWSRARACNA